MSTRQPRWDWVAASAALFSLVILAAGIGLSIWVAYRSPEEWQTFIGACGGLLTGSLAGRMALTAYQLWRLRQFRATPAGCPICGRASEHLRFCRNGEEES